MPASTLWRLRTRSTAAAVFAGGYPEKRLTVLPDMREQNLGRWQGLTHEEFTALLRDPPHPFWPHSAEERPPGGESVGDVVKRVGPVLDDLVDKYPGESLVIVAHGGSIRAAALAMGGDWHDLGGGLTEGDEASVSLQPLARIDDSYERAWAADWIAATLAQARHVSAATRLIMPAATPGARNWALLRDLENPDHWSESYHIATWDDYIRHNTRRTVTDAEMTGRDRHRRQLLARRLAHRVRKRPLRLSAALCHGCERWGCAADFLW